MVYNQFETTINVLRSDNGREYFTKHFSDFFSQKDFFNKVLVLEHPNKMVLKKGKTVTFWKLLEHCYLLIKSQKFSKEMQS